MDREPPRWLTKSIDWHDGLPQPRWEEIEAEVYRRVELGDESEVDLWREAALAWLTLLARELGPDYLIAEGSRTFALGSQATARVEKLCDRCDEIVVRFRRLLPDLVQQTEAGKHVVVAIEEPPTARKYLDYCFPDGFDLDESSAFFIRGGYRHLVVHGLARLELNSDPSIPLALVRASISHLPLPAWLELGIAFGALSSLVSDYATQHFPRNEHRKVWSETPIEEFWSGQAFEGAESEYAIDLACIVVRGLAEDLAKFQRFVLQVASGGVDAENAARQTLAVSLDAVVSEILG